MKFTKDRAPEQRHSYARRRRKPEEREGEESGRTGPEGEKEKETEKERRGRELGEEDHWHKEKGRTGTKLRGRYAPETCRNAKRCRSGSGTLLGKVSRHLRRPRNRRSIARVSCLSMITTHNYVSRVYRGASHAAPKFLENSRISFRARVPRRNRGTRSRLFEVS